MTSNELMQADLKVKILELLYAEHFKSNIAGLSVQALSTTAGSPENEVYIALDLQFNVYVSLMFIG